MAVEDVTRSANYDQANDAWNAAVEVMSTHIPNRIADLQNLEGRKLATT